MTHGLTVGRGRRRPGGDALDRDHTLRLGVGVGRLLGWGLDGAEVAPQRVDDVGRCLAPPPPQDELGQVGPVGLGGGGPGGDGAWTAPKSPPSEWMTSAAVSPPTRTMMSWLSLSP